MEILWLFGIITVIGVGLIVARYVIQTQRVDFERTIYRLKEQLEKSVTNAESLSDQLARRNHEMKQLREVWYSIVEDKTDGDIAVKRPIIVRPAPIGCIIHKEIEK